MIQLSLWPAPPAALSARLAARGCTLAYDPVTHFGYTAEWRVEDETE